MPKVYSVSLSVAVDSTLNNNNWSTISNISRQGLASHYWNVGDVKSVKITGHVEDTYINGTWYAFIIGFNHDTANSITFQIGETVSSHKKIAFCASNYADGGLTSGFIMKNSYSNEGGWALSYMRTHVLYSFLQAIESSLYNVLLATSRYTDNEGTTSVPNSASSVSVTTEKMFLLSAYEVTKDTTISNPNEGAKQKQYSYYASGNPIRKYNYNDVSSVVTWWTRSPYVRYPSNTNYFCNIGSVGVSTNECNQSFGITPCFCV